MGFLSMFPLCAFLFGRLLALDSCAEEFSAQDWGKAEVNKSNFKDDMLPLESSHFATEADVQSRNATKAGKTHAQSSHFGGKSYLMKQLLVSANSTASPHAPEYSEGLVRALEEFSEDFSAEEVVAWATDTFGEGLVLQTSAGTQSAIMLNLVTRVVPNVKVVFVDTGYLPSETVEYMETLREAMNLNLTIARPKLSPSELEAQYGKLWETDHELYGQITKVEPMNRVLKELGATAVLSGLRAGQTDTRAGLTKVCLDNGSDLIKILPILHWDKADIADYFKDNLLPRHPLESKGFATVGDAHSSRAMKAGETDERASRFGGKTQECGLHTQTGSFHMLMSRFQ